MKNVLVILFVLLLLVGYFVFRWRESGIPQDGKRVLSAPPPALTVGELKNAVYRTPECGTVTLRNGTCELTDRDARCSVTLLDKFATGDLTGDGASDAAVFLGSDMGGSGFFVSIAAVVNRDGRPEPLAAVALEDRIKINDVRIEAGIVRVAATVHSGAAPMCCPDSAVHWRFRVERDSLVRMADR